LRRRHPGSGVFFQRLYCHLLDGGLSDNLGLRGPYNAITTTDDAWSLVIQENLGRLKQLMVIAVNAKTSKKHKWDKIAKPPEIKDVLGVVTGGPMDDVSLDSVEMMREHFWIWKIKSVSASKGD